MGKKLLLGIGAIALVVAVALSVSSPETPALVGVSEVIAESPDFTYETFSQERYNELRGREAFAIFFHSESCGTCAKKHQQIVDEVGDFSGGVILKQEYSEAPTALLSELGVSNYDTFVVFDTEGVFQTLPGAAISDVRESISDMDSQEEASAPAPTPSPRKVIAESETFAYEQFTDERFEELRGSEAFAVFFHSNTCGTCAKKNQQIVDEVADFDGGVILKQEYSEAPTQLLAELEVTKYDTFVLFAADGTFQTILGASVDQVRDAIE